MRTTYLREVAAKWHTKEATLRQRSLRTGCQLDPQFAAAYARWGGDRDRQDWAVEH